MVGRINPRMGNIQGGPEGGGGGMPLGFHPRLMHSSAMSGPGGRHPFEGMVRVPGGGGPMLEGMTRGPGGGQMLEGLIRGPGGQMLEQMIRGPGGQMMSPRMRPQQVCGT